MESEYTLGKEIKDYSAIFGQSNGLASIIQSSGLLAGWGSKYAGQYRGRLRRYVQVTIF